jgi:NO-binding membrane sensor protein with MHYT domain
MEVHIGRQLAFSALAATGVFAMHFTGMSAATFYSSAPPTSDPGYPPALGFFIVATAISTCLISTYL